MSRLESPACFLRTELSVLRTDTAPLCSPRLGRGGAGQRSLDEASGTLRPKSWLLVAHFQALPHFKKDILIQELVLGRGKYIARDIC